MFDTFGFVIRRSKIGTPATLMPNFGRVHVRFKHKMGHAKNFIGTYAKQSAYIFSF